MLQIEVYEYNQKLSEVYDQYYNQFELINFSGEKTRELINFDERIKYKFQLIKKTNNPTIIKYLDFKKEDSKNIYQLIL